MIARLVAAYIVIGCIVLAVRAGKRPYPNEPTTEDLGASMIWLAFLIKLLVLSLYRGTKALFK